MIKLTASDAIVIGICTFRRPSLADTLSSLAHLSPLPAEVSILVADNDVTPTAAALVASIAVSHPLPIRHIHAPAGNISIARNAILQASRTAGARYLAFLDDDEVAAVSWLAALLDRQIATGADAVVGPVRALYGQDAPRWMQDGSVHDMRHEPGPDGLLLQGHTCNVLLDLASPALRHMQFDLARGRTGGEDTAFFRQMLSAGGCIAWAPDAVVQETVPQDRATLRWLLRRRYRMGQTHASLGPKRLRAPARAIAAVLATAKATACLGMAGLRCFDTLGRNRALMRGALHIGAVAELVGLDRVELYGDGPGMQKLTSPESAGR